MLHVDAGPTGRGERLERAYYDLVSTTARHFGRRGEGWFLSGVAGLDTPTMNRAVIAGAPPTAIDAVTAAAREEFGSRRMPWTVVLPTIRDEGRWHAALLARGYVFSSTLEVLARPTPLAVEPPEHAVREARADEMGRFVEMLLDVFRMPRHFYPALVDMTQAWRDAGARVYLTDMDDEPVGTALLSLHGGVAGIYNVGTVRGARSRGIARSMMQRALADAAGTEILTLQVAPGTIAEAFYHRLGFERQYDWRFYTPGPKLAGTR